MRDFQLFVSRIINGKSSVNTGVVGEEMARIMVRLNL